MERGVLLADAPGGRAVSPHLLPSPLSGLLASSGVAGCQPAPPSKPSFGSLGFFRCCELSARTSFQALFRVSWLLPVLRAVSPHLLPSPLSALLASSGAAGCQPAPPSKPSFGSLGFFRCCGLPRPAPPSKPSFGSLGFFPCCGLPARTSFQALFRLSWPLLPVLRAASPHLLPSPLSGLLASSGAAGCQPAPPSKPSFGSLGFFRCCGLSARTSFQALFRVSWLLPVLRAVSPHLLPSPLSALLASSGAAGCQPAPPSKPSFGSLDFFRCCGLSARTSFQALFRVSWLLPVLRAFSPHLLPSPLSSLLASSRAAGCQPAPPSKPSFGSLGFFRCCGLSAHTSFQALFRVSWLLPVLRAASPHLLPSPLSGLLASSGAAGCQPAPPSKPSFGSLGFFRCCGLSARTSSKPAFGSLGFFQCCGLLARTSFQTLFRVSWLLPVLRAVSPHLLPSPLSALLASSGAAGCQPAPPSKPSFGSLGFFPCCGLPARTSFQALFRVSWLLSVLWAVPSRTSFQALFRVSWLLSVLRAVSPHLLPNPLSGLLASSGIAGCQSAPPSKPSFGSLGFFPCCGLPARTSFQALFRVSWLLPVLRWQPAPPSKPSFGSLGFFPCCGLPARTSFQALFRVSGFFPVLRASLAFFPCCGLSARTFFQALFRVSWLLPVLRAASPHLLPSPLSGLLASSHAAGCQPAPPSKPFFVSLGFFTCCGLPALTSFHAPFRVSWLLPVLRAAGPHLLPSPLSALLASSRVTGCQPAPPSKPYFGSLGYFFPCCRLPARTFFQALFRLSWHLPVLRAVSPHLLPSPLSSLLASSGAAGCQPAPPSKPSFGSLGFFRCCGLSARTSFQALFRVSWLLPVLRAASPHLLPSPLSGLLASSRAAGWQPAPPSKPSFGSLGFFPCCGLPARTSSQALLQVSWFFPVLRASLAFFPCCGLPARTFFQALFRVSWLLPVLRAGSPHLLPSLLSALLASSRAAGFQAAPPSKPSFGSLGFFRCCGLPARTSFQALFRVSWLLPVLRAVSPHLLPSPLSGLLASSGAAGCQPAPPSKPCFGSLGFFRCCALSARTSFQALFRVFWLLPVLRAVSPHLLPSPLSALLASSRAAGCQPAPPSKPPFGSLGFFRCCGLSARTSFQALFRVSWPSNPSFGSLGFFPCCGQLAPPSKPSFGSLGFFRCCGLPARTSFQALFRLSWPLPVLRAASPHLLPSPLSALLATSSRAAGCQPAPSSKPSFGSLGFFRCCGLSARTSFQALFRVSWLLPVLRAASPHLLPSPLSGLLATSSVLVLWAASRISFQALFRLSWLLPVLRAASPHLLPTPLSGLLASSRAAGCQPAPPSKPPFGSLGFFPCCGLPAI